MNFWKPCFLQVNLKTNIIRQLHVIFSFHFSGQYLLGYEVSKNHSEIIFSESTEKIIAKVFFWKVPKNDDRNRAIDKFLSGDAFFC